MDEEFAPAKFNDYFDTVGISLWTELNPWVKSRKTVKKGESCHLVRGWTTRGGWARARLREEGNLPPATPA